MLKQAIASYPATTALSRYATITSARVDPEAPPAIFRPLRRTGPSGPRPKAPVAELVDALELKIEFRKECWFDSGQGHHSGIRPHPPTFTFLNNDGYKSHFWLRGRSP